MFSLKKIKLLTKNKLQVHFILARVCKSKIQNTEGLNNYQTAKRNYDPSLH